MVIKVSVPDRFQFKMVPTFKNMMMLKQGDVHYIGGSDVLPAPLGAEEEARAIAGPVSYTHLTLPTIAEV